MSSQTALVLSSRKFITWIVSQLILGTSPSPVRGFALYNYNKIDVNSRINITILKDALTLLNFILKASVSCCKYPAQAFPTCKLYSDFTCSYPSELLGETVLTMSRRACSSNGVYSKESLDHLQLGPCRGEGLERR